MLRALVAHMFTEAVALSPTTVHGLAPGTNPNPNDTPLWLSHVHQFREALTNDGCRRLALKPHLAEAWSEWWPQSSPLLLLMVSDALVLKETRAATHGLWMRLLVDTTFKRAFVGVVATAYRYLLGQFCGGVGTQEDSVFQFTVQVCEVFVPTLALVWRS